MARPAAAYPTVPGRLDAALAQAEQAPPRATEGPTTITYTEQLDEGRTFSIGPEVETVLGYTQAEWMADPLLWVSLMHSDDRERVVEACNAANETLETFRAEYQMIARDGRVVLIRDEAEVVYGAQGQPLCWEGIMTVAGETLPLVGGGQPPESFPAREPLT